MAEVDTSSYQKPPALPVQKSLLDQVQQFQQIDSTQLAQQQAKLNQANQALGYMTRAMGSLGPDATKEQYLAVGQNAVKMGLVPPNMLNSYVERLQAAPDAKSFYNEFTTAAATHQETINYHLGQPGVYSNGQTDQPVVTSQKHGFGMRPTGLPIQRQIPPTTPVYDANNQPTLQGPTAPIAPSGIATGPGQRLPVGSNQPIQPNPVRTLPIGPVNNPAINGQSSNFGGNVTDATVEPPSPNKVVGNRYPAPSGPAVGTPPMFEEGKKQLVEDQNAATQKLTGIKNAQKALALLPGVESGPGTGPYQQALAFLKAQGVLSTDPKDKTVIYQEINKYLNRYVQQSGLSQRSDAAQQLAESSNPNLMTQLNPALVNLTRSAIGLDKVEIARPRAFNSKDYSKYGEHRTSFPQSQDDRAYSLSDLPKPEAQKLYQEMKAKALAGDPEGIKFIKSLVEANKQGL